MESDKSKETHRGRNRRKGGKKGESYLIERMRNPKSKELAYPAGDSADGTADVLEQKTSALTLENSDNCEGNSSSFMCPALHRQLQTHQNILRLLHEHKLVSTQINGQRILSIQPIRWNGPAPGIECEIFVGRIPKTIYEDTLYPLFKLIGEIFQIRLMVDMAELTRGYCFIMYTSPGDAARAIAQLDEYEILPGNKIRVLASIDNCKLYVGPLPWSIASEEVVRVIYASTWDIQYVSIYRFLNHDAAYAIVSFKSHRNAALARRKLRPERLFKCNEVHVDWARVDWNPSNVYEDRGTVNDKGDVQITRNYLQSKKTASSSAASVQKNSNHYRKQISPISPPDNSRTNFSQFVRSKNTRYSTMLTMAAALDNFSSFDSSNKKLEVIPDINDNTQQYGNEDKTHWKDATDNFPSFDMWNSHLVPQLPSSPTNLRNLKDHEAPHKMLNKISRGNIDWENNIKHSKISYFNGYQYENNASVSNYCQLNRNHSSSEMVGHNEPIAVVTSVPYQTSEMHQNQSTGPYYILLQPHNYSNPAIINHICHDHDQTGAFLSTIYDHGSHWYNRQNCVQGFVAADPNFAVEKSVDRKSRHSAISIKAENGTPMLYPINFSSNYVSNYAPNFVPNPVYNPLPNVASENVSSRLVSFNIEDKNDEKYLRPILKRITDHVQQ